MIEDFYNTSAEVKQMATAKNNMGGVTKTYSTRISALLCRVTPRAINEADEYGKMTVSEGARLYCDATSTNKAIEASDQVVFNSRTFEIKAIGNPGYLDHHLQIDLREVD